MKKLIFGAGVIAVGGVIAKLIGAIYRIPLTRIIGAEGIGVYQMVFPFYCILLTLSSTGIPSGIAKLTAEGRKDVFFSSLVVFGGAGLIGSLIMFFGADTISSVQGNPAAATAYKALSPSVFAVSLLSCFRGRFQGTGNMFPTALSQIAEQVVKLFVGVILCYYFGSTLFEKAAFAALAVTVSEVVALVMVVCIKRERFPILFSPSAVKIVVSTVFPIVLSSVMIPLSRAVDSFTAIRLLDIDVRAATYDYGIFSGVVEPVISLPVAVCYSFAVSGLPLIAAKSDIASKEAAQKKVIIYTFGLSAAFSVLIYLFADLIVGILYGGLGGYGSGLAVKLLKLSCPSVVGLSLVQSFTATLIGKGKLYMPSVGLIIGVLVKTAATFLLVPLPGIGVYGYAFSDIFCYFVATIVFLLYTVINKRKTEGGAENGLDGHRAWCKQRGYFGKRAQ